MSKTKYTPHFEIKYKEFIARTKMFNPDMKQNEIATRAQYYQEVYFQICGDGRL